MERDPKDYGNNFSLQTVLRNNASYHRSISSSSPNPDTYPPREECFSLVTNWILFVKPVFVSKSDTVWEPDYNEGRRLKCLSTADK